MLQLKDIYYSKIDLTSQDGVMSGNSKNEILVKVGLQHNKDSANLYRVELTIRLEKPKEGTAAYIGEIIALGVFEVSADIESKEREKICLVDGASVLYSSARELIRIITGRGLHPHQAVILPIVSFSQVVKNS